MKFLEFHNNEQGFYKIMGFHYFCLQSQSMFAVAVHLLHLAKPYADYEEQ